MKDGIWTREFDAKLIREIPKRIFNLVLFRLQYITGCDAIFVPNASWNYIGPWRWSLPDAPN